MKNKITFRFLTRILSLVSVLVSAAVPLFFISGETTLPVFLGFAFVIGLTVLSAYPGTGENSRGSLFAAVVISVLCMLSRFLFEGRLFIPVTVLSIIILIALRTYARFSRIKSLFRQRAVWTSIEDYYRLCLLTATVMCLLFLSASGGDMARGWVAAVISAALYVVEYISFYYSRVLFLPRSREEAIHELIRGNLRTFPMASDDEDARMSNLYSRVNEYMEKSKPFLEENFDIQTLASAVYTNKTYLSRTINYFSGRNFKQFINYHRVRYSVSLMEKDPHLKVMELASMCGFHSVVTYNMAFKMFLNDTPAAYRQQLRIRNVPGQARGEMELL